LALVELLLSSVAYISDVIITLEHRSNGLGKWLVDTMVNDPRWKGIFQLLVTDDAHSLYERFGFSRNSQLLSTKVSACPTETKTQ